MKSRGEALRDYIVRRHELSREQFALLTAIARAQTLAESLASNVTITPEEIRAWFTTWSATGFFSQAR